MTLVGQPPSSPALKQALQLLAEGKGNEGEAVVKKAALQAKAQHGSGSHPLAQAYADMARYHLRSGETERAAQEFQHASKGPMPTDKELRQDRLAFMLGFGTALEDLGRFEEAEKVFRQCLAFARNLNGGQSATAAVVLVPLAEVLMRSGKTAEGAKLAIEAYDSLWKLGDAAITFAVGARAEGLKAGNRADSPFADLAELPDEMVSAAVASVTARAGKGDVGRMRAVLSDLVSFLEKKYGDGHALICDALAAVVRHEAAAGDKADDRVRRGAVRKSVWSFVVRRMPGGLMANLEVAFEHGTIHLAPHLSRDPSPAEAAQLETILTQAVDDLYARPAITA